VDEPVERHEDLLRLDDAALEPRTMDRKPLAQRVAVGVQQVCDLVERHLELPQAADRLRLARLRERVVAVARRVVDDAGRSSPTAS
jgi:hypothetical protein